MREPSVIILGGGAVGLCIARALARSGESRVLLLEATDFGAGATCRSLGMVRVLHGDRYVTDLAAESFPHFQRHAATNGFVRTGLLRFFHEGDLASMASEVARLTEAGMTLEVLEPEQGRRRFPHVDWSGTGGAVLEELAGHCDPAAACALWLAEARAAGVEATAGVHAEEIVVDGGRVAGVRTHRGLIETARVVVATGAWAPTLLNTLAGPAEAIRTKRIQANRYSWSDSVTRYPAIIDPTTGLYGRPGADGSFLLGLPLEAWDRDPEASESWQLTPQPQVAEIGARRMPNLARATVGEGTCGLDAYTATGRGRLENVESVEGLTLATGWSGAGFKLAPAIGARLAREFVGCPA